MPTYLQSINQALDRKLKENNHVLLLGEDICDPYGGAFKVTKGLSTKYPEQVINTPMSEWALTGVAAGVGLRGFRPVLEIMFGDFLTLCADQLINHAVKFRWMSNGRANVPLVIRTPMGGRRGYGPTHSQSLEKMFLGIPGLKVIAPSNYHNPGTLLECSIEDNDPVLFIEQKHLYSRPIADAENISEDGFSVRKSQNNYYTVSLSNNDFNGSQVTILSYGGMIPLVIDAVRQMAEAEEVLAEIIIPSYLNDKSMVETLESVKRTGRLIIVEEGTLSNGWGAEMAARVFEEGFECLEAPIKRVAAKELPIGNSRVIEDAIMPQIADICRAVREVLAQ